MIRRQFPRFFSSRPLKQREEESKTKRGRFLSSSLPSYISCIKADTARKPQIGILRNKEKGRRGERHNVNGRVTRKTSFSSPSLIFRDFCANESPLPEMNRPPRNVLSSGYADSSTFLAFFFSSLFFPTTIVPRLTRQPPCFLLFPSILFAPRMYPIIYKSFVDGIFSMKVKKYASRSEKNNFDRFRIIPRYRLYVYMRYLIIIRTRIVYIHYIYSNVFIERDRVSILFSFLPPFERAVATRTASSPQYNKVVGTIRTCITQFIPISLC